MYHRQDEKGLNWEPGGVRSGAGVCKSGVSQESSSRSSHNPKSVPQGSHQNFRSAFETSAAASRWAALAEASRNINKARARMGVAGPPCNSIIVAA